MPEAAPSRWLAPLSAAALACYWLALFVSTHIPMPARVAALPDKTLHMTGYAILTFLLAVAWGQRRHIGFAQLLIILSIIAGYGAFDEITQSTVGRTPDFADWLADVAGAIIGLTGFVILRAVTRGTAAGQIFGVGGR